MAQNVELGGSWAPFGKALGRSGPSCGHFWGHFGRFWGGPNHIFLKLWSKMGSQRPFGGILGRFGKVLGRFLEGLGRNLGGFWEEIWKDWKLYVEPTLHFNFNLLGGSWNIFACFSMPGPPRCLAKHREASQFGSWLWLWLWHRLF